MPVEGDRIDLKELMKLLARRDITSVLVEGGGVLTGSLFDAGLVDKVIAVISPMIIGGKDAPMAVAGTGVSKLKDAFRLQKVKVDTLGEDIVLSGYVGK